MMNKHLGFMITGLAIASIPSALPDPLQDPILDPILEEVECLGVHSRVVTSARLVPAASSPEDEKSGVMADTYTGAKGVFVFVDSSDGHSYDFTGVIKKYVRCDGYKPDESAGRPAPPV